MSESKKEPLISFVLPTKDRVEWVAECVSSILSQKVKDIELIIVDDGSTDGTKEFLAEWPKDERVTVIRNEVSLGGGKSRNIGMEAAKAPIIAVCDDDDWYSEDRATLILEHFKQNEKSELVNFPYIQVGYENEEIERFDGKEFDHKAFIENGIVSYFANPTVAYKKASAMEMGGYPSETENQTDDVQFLQKWIQAGKKVDFQPGYYVCGHRVLPNSMMSKLRGFDPKWATK